MNLYEKIGRLIKQNKIFDLSSNSNNDSKTSNENQLKLEIETIESILSDILAPLKSDFQSPLSHIKFKNNKLFSKSDLEEAQNLIKSCSQSDQLILIAILEIHISLIGNENNYVKYEKINQKIVEKNIYWVITCEIHRRIHKTKVDFEEYCHCIKDQKEKYILGSEHNFRYDNIDSIICKLKYNNKKIEFIAIKSIFISFYNLTCEFVDKYIEIMEYNKKTKSDSVYLIFDYIINDYLYIIDKIKFLQTDFKQSLNDFIAAYNINFSFENLFKDIFFNVIFHNQILGFQYIHGFIHADTDMKNLFAKILNLISSIKYPIMKHIGKILDLDGILGYKCDLLSKIMEQNEEMHICVGVGKCEIKSDDEIEEIIEKKGIILLKGKIDNKNQNESEFNSDKENNNLEKNKDKDKEDICNINNNNNIIIEEKLINNKTESSNKKIISEDQSKDKEEIDQSKQTTENSNDENNNEENKQIIIKKENKEENNYPDINNTKNESTNDKTTMENRSIDEICEYINKDNKVKGKKKHKKRNKAKLKKKKNKSEINESTVDDSEDPLVIQFKNDIQESFINANSITKIKPFISDEFIKKISSD